MKRPAPISSFSRRLLNLLLKGAIEPQRFYAETNHSPPQLFNKGTTIPLGARDSACSTRWHIIVFSSPAAALRFKEFQRLTQRLHTLRRSMKEENHPDTGAVYSVRISLDDRLGMLEIAPSDTLLDTLISSTPSQTTVPTPQLSEDEEFSDPLDKLG